MKARNVDKANNIYDEKKYTNYNKVIFSKVSIQMFH